MPCESLSCPFGLTNVVVNTTRHQLLEAAVNITRASLNLMNLFTAGNYNFVDAGSGEQLLHSYREHVTAIIGVRHVGFLVQHCLDPTGALELRVLEEVDD